MDDATDYNKQKELKDMTYYVVEVALRKTNPIHLAIVFHRSSGWLELITYEDYITKKYTDLPYFKIVEEIKSMKEDFENNHKLPEKEPGNE